MNRVIFKVRKQSARSKKKGAVIRSRAKWKGNEDQGVKGVHIQSIGRGEAYKRARKPPKEPVHHWIWSFLNESLAAQVS